jgi:hypothetical protein
VIRFILTYKLALNSLKVQLAELEPLFEPEPVPFTFNTPAWYVLGILLLILSIYVFFLQLKKYKKNRYRRDALKALGALNLSYSNYFNIILNEIRIVLYGQDWLEFLESKGKGTPFKKYNILIKQDAFLGSEKEKQNVIDLVEVSKNWIKTHA